jgi:hypothetical protein
MTAALRFHARSAVRVTAVVMFAVAVSSTRLRAQDIVYAASLSDLDSVTQAVLGREIARARDRGLPVEPLVAKVREGRLKRAPALLIRAAVERLRERLSAAREALGATSSPEELTAGADAIAAGAQGASLRAVRAATTQSVTAPIGALAQLLASGVAEAKAVDMVVGLLRRNASPALLVALGNLVEADVATGLLPNASAAFRLRALEGVLNGTVTTDAAAANINAGAAGNGPASPPRRKP